MGVWKN